MTRLFNLAAGMGLPSARYALFGQAHTGDLQKRRYTTWQNKAVGITTLKGIVIALFHVLGRLPKPAFSRRDC